MNLRLLLLPLSLLLCITAIDAAAQSDDRLTVRLRTLADNAPIADATVRLLDESGTFIEEQQSDGERGEAIFDLGSSSVNDRSASTALGSIAPNPVTGRASMPLSISFSDDVRIGLYDLLGRERALFEGYLPAGDHLVEMTTGELEAGRYLVRIESNGQLLGTRGMNVLRSSAGEARISVAGSSLRADKGANVVGSYKIEVSHPDYRTVRRDVEVDGKTLVVVQMERVEFVPEFGRSFDVTVIADARSGLDVPRDLEFHPTRRNELWVVNRAFDGTVTYWWPGTDSMESFRVRDANANHFMEEVSAIAFSTEDYFATAQESQNTYDGQGQPNNFMGPALWTADTSIYHKDDLPGWGGLGSHLDMLHESPNGMGIAHDYDNVYWYADGFYGNIVRYDFGADHGPGWDDHSDGIVRRYVDASITRWPGVPGHLVLDKQTGWLYVADPGNRRVMRLDTRTGSFSSSGNVDNSQLENLREYSRYAGATYETVANEKLDRPSGIAIANGRLFVSDNATGEIIAYSLDDLRELNRIETNAGSIMGIEIGPDGHIWYVDAERNQVLRIDPQETDD